MVSKEEFWSPAYKLGRVNRLQESDLVAFIQSARIEPGSLEHLYAETGTEETENSAAD